MRISFRIIAAALALVSCQEPSAPIPVATVTMTSGPGGYVILASGATMRFVASALDADGRTLHGRRITWTSDDTSLVAVDSTGLAVAGYVLEDTIRQANISASVGGQTASVPVFVYPSVPATLEGFASLTLAHGDSVRFTPIMKDSVGNVLVGREISYVSSESQIARIEGNVLRAGAHLGPGNRVVDIEVRFSGPQSVNFTVTVPPTTVDRVEMHVGNGFVPVSRSRQLRAFAVSSFGALVQGAPPITWTAGASSAATLSPDGVISGVSDGTITVSASAGARTATHTITVNECGTGPAGAHPIEIRHIGATPDPVVERAFRCATARLQSVIVGALPPVQYTNVSEVSCNSGTLNETVPGLLIFVAVAAHDGVGGLTSLAHPCLLRDGSFLPSVGFMKFDVADIPDLIDRGLLEDVITHEMLHVLGFGTVWEPKSLVGGHFQGMDWRWKGQAANAECRRDFAGVDICATGVPVETCYRIQFLPGCEGLNRTHWHEELLGEELMTGFLDAPRNPLSSITLASLADLGYQVDASQADAFSFVPLPTAPALMAMPRPIRMSKPGKPTGIVDRYGRVRPLAR